MAASTAWPLGINGDPFPNPLFSNIPPHIDNYAAHLVSEHEWSLNRHVTDPAIAVVVDI